jgi:hypothetical protein
MVSLKSNKEKKGRRTLIGGPSTQGIGRLSKASVVKEKDTEHAAKLDALVEKDERIEVENGLETRKRKVPDVEVRKDATVEKEKVDRAKAIDPSESIVAAKPNEVKEGPKSKKRKSDIAKEMEIPVEKVDRMEFEEPVTAKPKTPEPGKPKAKAKVSKAKKAEKEVAKEPGMLEVDQVQAEPEPVVVAAKPSAKPKSSADKSRPKKAEAGAEKQAVDEAVPMAVDRAEVVAPSQPAAAKPKPKEPEPISNPQTIEPAVEKTDIGKPAAPVVPNRAAPLAVVSKPKPAEPVLKPKAKKPEPIVAVAKPAAPTPPLQPISKPILQPPSSKLAPIPTIPTTKLGTSASTTSISTFLHSSLLSRVFTVLQGNTLASTHICRIHLDLFPDPDKLQIAERFVFQMVLAYLGGERTSAELLSPVCFLPFVDSVRVESKVPDLAVLTVSETGKEEKVDAVVLRETGQPVPWISKEAFEKVASGAGPKDPEARREPTWSKKVDAEELKRTAGRYLVANIETELLKGLVSALLRNPSTRLPNLIAQGAGHRTLMDQVAEEVSAITHLSPFLAEILPTWLEEPLLVLRLTGEVVGQDGVIGSPLWNRLINFSNWPSVERWNGIAAEWQNKGLQSAMSLVEKVGEEARHGDGYWVSETSIPCRVQLMCLSRPFPL